MKKSECLLRIRQLVIFASLVFGFAAIAEKQSLAADTHPQKSAKSATDYTEVISEMRTFIIAMLLSQIVTVIFL